MESIPTYFGCDWYVVGVKRNFEKREAGKKAESRQLAAQPTLNLDDRVACGICGAPVDRKRMKFHIVRFHGAVA